MPTRKQGYLRRFFLVDQWLPTKRKQRTRNCWACDSVLRTGASICTECGTWQDRKRHLGIAVPLASLFVATIGMFSPAINDMIKNISHFQASGVIRASKEPSYLSNSLDESFEPNLTLDIFNKSNTDIFFSGDAYCSAFLNESAFNAINKFESVENDIYKEVHFTKLSKFLDSIDLKFVFDIDFKDDQEKSIIKIQDFSIKESIYLEFGAIQADIYQVYFFDRTILNSYKSQFIDFSYYLQRVDPLDFICFASVIYDGQKEVIHVIIENEAEAQLLALLITKAVEMAGLDRLEPLSKLQSENIIEDLTDLLLNAYLEDIGSIFANSPRSWRSLPEAQNYVESRKVFQTKTKSQSSNSSDNEFESSAE